MLAAARRSRSPRRSACAALAWQIAGAALQVAAFVLSILVLVSCVAAGEADVAKDVSQGALRIVQKDGSIVECQLKHTQVLAEVTGFIARVKVTQTFHNPLDEKIEAVYVFPLPHESAVDEMTMVIGERRIIGLIKRRAEARQIYEQALLAGQTAALLEQERPNIFTQSVGNIPPKQEVRIEISYADVLKYDQGAYEFHFPMVVGPRYIPGNPESSIPPVPPELQGKVGELDKNKIVEGAATPKGAGWSPDTDRVGDASRITPPVLKPGTRNGHDVALSLSLDAGVPIQDLKIINHQGEMKRDGQSKATVVMSPADSIPNKDFVMRYGVMGRKPELALLTHADGSMGYFMLMIQPREDERLKQSPPREIVFLVDVSGSMSGLPTEKVKQTMQKMLTLCREKDTVQVITFANNAQKLFDAPVPVNEANIRTALDFMRGVKGGGGTEMLKGIKLAIGEPPDKERVRIVMLLTDGFIGNEAEIIKEVGSRCGDRIKFWCLGIGNSVNRFLVDGVAKQSGGMGKVVNLNEDPEPTVQEVMARIHSAQLAKIKLDWGGMGIGDTYPAKLPDLWSGRPVIIYGLYFAGEPKKTKVTVSGEIEGQPASWPIEVDFPAAQKDNGVLAKVWARQKIEDLMQQTYYQGSPDVIELVTNLALDYGLMTQYTSFVAVDQSEAARIEPSAKPPRRMLVPVPIPEGTSFEGFFGGDNDKFEANGLRNELRLVRKAEASYKMAATAAPAPSSAAGGGGWGGAPAAEAAAAGSFGVRSGGGRRMMVTRYGGMAGPAAGPAPISAGKPQARAAMVVGGGTVALDSLARNGRARELSEGGLLFLANDWQTINEQMSKLRERFNLVVRDADEAQKKGDLAQARAGYTFALLLNSALTQRGWGNVYTARPAEAGEETCRAELLKAWTKSLPALDKKLDLIIRDKPLAEALEAVAKAAGIKADLLAGSLADSCANLAVKEARVTFLDLRHATAAQALDWLLGPARLAWWAGENGVTAASPRLAPVTSAWVYDVAAIALPLKDEIEAVKEEKERPAAARKALDDFLSAARKALELKDDNALWYSPGQLLVFADAKLHAAAAKLFADLANSDAKLDASLEALHKACVARASQRKDVGAKLLRIGAQRRLVEVLSQHSWSLLASASSGQSSLEALTELQVAWQDGELPELLKGPGAPAALRSLYALCAGAAALPKDEELAALAKQARELARVAAGNAVAAFEQTPQDGAACLNALYAALALRDDGLSQRVRKAAAQGLEQAKPGSVVLALADALLAAQPDQAALLKLLKDRDKEIRGDELVSLAALACRRAGGDAWNAFRAAAQDLLGQQPLSGSVVVFVNSLSRTALPLR